MGGVDKAALRVGGERMLDRVLLAARPLCDRLVVAGPARPTVVQGVEFVLEDPPGGGPVPAVVAGLAIIPEVDVVLIVAGDLPLLTSPLLRHLVSTLGASSPGTGAVAASGPDGEPNPLLAAYRATALRSAARDLGAGAAAALLLPPTTVVVDLGPGAMNVNRREDLEMAQRRAERETRDTVRDAADRDAANRDAGRRNPAGDAVGPGPRDGDAMSLGFPERYAAALRSALEPEEIDTVLDLARLVAHGSERRSAPLSTYLVGQFVAERRQAGVAHAEALAEAVLIAERILAESTPVDDT